MRPDVLCGLLAEPDRLRVFAAVSLGAGTPSEVAAATGQPARTVAAALRRLQTGGAIDVVDGRFRSDAAVFKDAVREYAPPPASEAPLDADRERDQVLRTFISEGRLTQMPAARGKRRVVLEHIVASFEPGVRYPERTVDAILRAWYDDHASLRRYLVDEELLERASGEYWRTGGYVEV